MSEEAAKIRVIRVPGWEQYSWLRHGFSSRPGGVSQVYGEAELNLGFTAHDEADKVAENRRRFVEAVAGSSAAGMVTVRQVHGAEVLRVDAGHTGLATADGRAALEADGMITGDPGVMLGIQVADCVPVLVADTRLRVVAAFHAGWRGTVARIVEQGIARLGAEFGSRPEDMVGAVGPAIGVCCYTVGDEVRGRFSAHFAYADELFADREDGLHVDLAEANRRQMLAAGLRAEAVTLLGACTACSRVDGRRQFFSHRAENGFTGRAMGMIGIAK